MEAANHGQDQDKSAETSMNTEASPNLEGLPPDEARAPVATPGDWPAGKTASSDSLPKSDAGADLRVQLRALPWPMLSGLLLVMIASCLVGFVGLGRYPLFNPDEALYAEPAREMLVTGEYVTTLLNYVVRYTKPPLAIWAMAFAYKLFGVNEFAARFFCVASGAVLVAVVYLMVARYISTRAAVAGALSLIVAPLFTLTAREAITDMPLALFMAGSQMAFFHAFKSKKFGFARAAYFLLGLAVMTKGPVGLVLPLAIVFAYHFLRGELRTALAFYQPVRAAATIGAIAVPWFAVEIWVTHGAYFQEFIVRENFQRFTTVVDSHKQPFWYHAAAMLGGYFPFSLYLPQIIWRQLRALKPSLQKAGGLGERLTRLKDYLQSQSDAEDLFFYCLLWAMAVLIFFSLSVSKLLPYTLPGFPALAILVAGELEGAFVSASFARLCYPMLAMILLYSGAGIFAPKLMLKARALPAGLPTMVTSFAAVQTAAAVISMVLGRLRLLVASVNFFVLSSCAVFGVYLNMALPLVSEKLEGPIPEFAHYVGQSDLPVIVFDMRKPGVPFYALRRVQNINGGDELRQKLSEIRSAYILTTVNKIDFLQGIRNTRVLSRRGDFALLLFTSAAVTEQK